MSVPHTGKLYKKSPTNPDLAKLFSGIANQYSQIGNALGVGAGDLAGLRESPKNNKVKLSEVFQLWMDMYEDVTWGKIVQMCTEIGDNRTRAAVVKFLDGDEAQDRYLEMDDFTGL